MPLDFLPPPADFLPALVVPASPTQSSTAVGLSCLQHYWSALCSGARLFVAYAARRWRELDRNWRIWSVCTVLAALFLPLLFVFNGRETGPVVGQSETAVKNGEVPTRSQDCVPIGVVRVVNRGTGRDTATWRIEPAGEFYKLKKEPSGRYVAIADWAKSGDEGTTKPRMQMLREVEDSGTRAMLWKIEAGGNGYWTITNCESKKCLIDPKNNYAACCTAIVVSRRGPGAAMAS